MNPPPPMLPANGCVTASANAVATAASTALPPFANTDAPASDATSDDDTTRPVFEATPRLAGVWARGAAVKRRTTAIKPRRTSRDRRRAVIETESMAGRCSPPWVLGFANARARLDVLENYRRHPSRLAARLLALCWNLRSARHVSTR